MSAVRLPGSRLYWRMFLYTAGAIAAFAVLSLVSTALVAFYELENYVQTRHSSRGREAAAALTRYGRAGLERWLAEEAAIPAGVSIYVLDPQGRDILGRELPERFRSFVHASIALPPDTPAAYRPTRLVPQLVAPDGTVYSFVVLPAGFSWWGSPGIVLALVAAALLVIASVAWLIAHAFGGPVTELQRAVRELASGRTDSRVPARICRRRDELGALAADFNSMAVRLARLLGSQQQLMRDLSHELRSPLARLQAALALAHHHGGLGTGDHQRLEREIARMDRLIGDILRLSRLDATGTVTRRLVRLDLLLQEIVRDEEVEAASHGCRLALRAPDALAAVGDPDVLRSGIENLVRNAIRFAPADTAVEITAYRSGERLVVCVEDRGPGVPAEHLERIFEPYFRIPGTSGAGSGLGLAIARRVFTLHGGSVAAANRRGGGLCLTGHLPSVQVA